MTKYCPIISYRKNNWDNIFCMGQECALWDEKREQCCFKTQALAEVSRQKIEKETLNKEK